MYIFVSRIINNNGNNAVVNIYSGCTKAISLYLHMYVFVYIITYILYLCGPDLHVFVCIFFRACCRLKKLKDMVNIFAALVLTGKNVFHC